VVVPPRSELAGERVFAGMVTDSGDLVVLGVQRKGEEVPGECRLAVGDTLLVQGTWRDLDRHLSDMLVDDPTEQVRRAVPLGQGAKRALAVLAAMVVLLATGAVPPAVAGLFVFTAVLGQLISNVATALIVIPSPSPRPPRS
jgi:di/tricarboxylate transporter